MMLPVEKWTNTVAVSLPRKYKEWEEIRPGEVHPRIFHMEELFRVRQSVRTWNATQKAVLSIQRLPGGTPEHPEPHFRVGWDASHTFDPHVIRTSPARFQARKKRRPKKDSESETGQKE